jgi:hypothetical protein
VQFRDLADSATTWIGQRTLDTSYLSPPSQIRLWSDHEHVYIAWDNSFKVFHGSPAWSAGCGNYVDMPDDTAGAWYETSAD